MKHELQTTVPRINYGPRGDRAQRIADIKADQARRLRRTATAIVALGLAGTAAVLGVSRDPSEAENKAVAAVARQIAEKQAVEAEAMDQKVYAESPGAKMDKNLQGLLARVGSNVVLHPNATFEVVDGKREYTLNLKDANSPLRYVVAASTTDEAAPVPLDVTVVAGSGRDPAYVATLGRFDGILSGQLTFPGDQPGFIVDSLMAGTGNDISMDAQRKFEGLADHFDVVPRVSP